MVNGKGDLLPMKSSLVLFLFLGSQVVFAHSSVKDIWYNNQAVEQIEQKKMLEAHEGFTQLLAKEPFHPVFQFNLGSSFIAIEDVQKAIKMYSEVVKLSPLPAEIEFATYFNLGVLYAISKNTDKALENYQKALRLNPASKEIKTNIELLFKGGKGKGKGKDKNKSKDNKKGEGEGDKKEQEGENPNQKKKFSNKQQPGQFKSKNMSKNDVKKILNELKKQEQRIRAKHQRKGKREADREKSW